MPTCGYLCPKCEGKGYLEDGNECDWCSNSPPSDSKNEPKTDTIKDQDWINTVHNGPCCGDLGLKE